MKRVLIISECGINHGGSILTAKEQIYESAKAGADIAKFQYYDPIKILGPNHPDIEYAKECQFTKEQHEALKKHCDKMGIEYLVSVFDVADIPWADKLCRRHKVATRMNRHIPFIEALKQTQKQVIASVQGFFTPEKGVDYIWCVPEYPTPLYNMPTNYTAVKGLSSHCPNIAPSILAVARGATILENHTTFNRNAPGCDQSSSITYSELKTMVSIVRDMEQMS